MINTVLLIASSILLVRLELLERRRDKIHLLSTQKHEDSGFTQLMSEYLANGQNPVRWLVAGLPR
jgi:hypothetical protein